MARTRTWHTTHDVTGATGSTPPRWVNLTSNRPDGATVVRTIASVHWSATHDSATEPPRPILLTAGLLVGDEPTGSEMGQLQINLQDWLWLGSESMTPGTFGDSTVYWTNAGGELQRIRSSGRRVLTGTENVWMLVTASLTSARTFNSSLITARVLWLDPDQ